MYCTKCGSKVDDGSKFCNFCGQPIENISNFDNASTNLSKLRNIFKVSRKTGISVLLPLLVLLLGIYWFFVRYSGPDIKFVQTDATNYFRQDYTKSYGKDSTYVPDIQVKVGDGKKSHENVVFVPVSVEVNEKMEKKEIIQPNGRKYIRNYGDNTKKIMYYLFVYQKNKDKQWIRKYAYPFDMEKWQLNPLAGVEDDRFRASVTYELHKIMGSAANGNNGNSKNNIKIDNIKIINRKVDLAKRTEEIDFSCDYVNKNSNYAQQYRDVAMLQFDYNFPELTLNPYWKIVGLKSKMK